MKKTTNSIVSIVLLFVFTACGSSSSKKVDDNLTMEQNATAEQNITEEIDTIVIPKTKGYLIDAPIEGATYVCASGEIGLTNEEGMFECEEAPVSFFIGKLKLGNISHFTEDGKVYPQDLLGLERDNFSNAKLKLMARLMQSVDNDGNIDKAITIEQSVRDAFNDVTNFTDLSENDVKTLLSKINKPLTNECAAMEHLGDKSVTCNSDGSYYVYTPPVVVPTPVPTPPEERPFITTWKTDNTDANDKKTIKIATKGTDYNYTVDWGDGNSSTDVDGNISHAYDDIGTYTVKISGDFPKISNPSQGVNPITGEPIYVNDKKLLSIEQWGTTKWISFKQSFQFSPNLVINATDEPDLSRVTDMSQMFLGASKVDLDVSDWNVSNVTDMTEMFKDANLSTSNYNALLNSWSQKSLQDNVVFDAGNTEYYIDFEADRQSIIDTFGWTISDGGGVTLDGGGQ